MVAETKLIWGIKAGIYVVRLRKGGEIYSEKVIIRP